MRTVLMVGLAVATVMVSGCITAEQHVTVREDAKTDLGYALRLPGMAGMMLDQVLSQQGAGGALPGLPGVKIEKRTEGAETVLEVGVNGDMLPRQMGSLFRVSTSPRLLTKTYRFSMDPKAINPQELMKLPQLLQAPDAGQPEVMFTQLNIPGLPNLDLKSPEALGDMLGALGGLFGGEGGAGLDRGVLLGQVEFATYVHMPGVLTSTNGERADECTAKWAMEPKALTELTTMYRLTAESEGPNRPRIERLSAALTEHHGARAGVSELVDLAARGLIPNPEVAGDAEPVIDTHLYGELVSLASGLDQLVGRENTPRVMERLSLLGAEPTLSRATHASKRLENLRAEGTAGVMGLEELMGALGEE